MRIRSSELTMLYLCPMSNQFPQAFENRVKNDPFLGEKLLISLDSVPPVSVRFHPQKPLGNLDFLVPVSWCELAYYLNERPVFTLDPLFHAGVYYPQEAGSMLLDYVLRKLNLPENPVVLDLCAAPGGKSTLIASFLGNKGLLVSNEVINQRAKILRENTTKWGFTNTIVTNNDPKDFERLPDFFDVIVVDAPCSGEGMFRKDVQAREEWSEENVEICCARQKRIVMDVWDALKPGGFLIYSTCTFNDLENELNVKWLTEQTDSSLIPIEWPETITTGRDGTGAYCLPGTSKTEGFYIAVFQKSEGEIQKQYSVKNPVKNPVKNKAVTKVKVTEELLPFIHPEEVSVYNWQDKLLALPKGMEDAMLQVQSAMKLLKMGTMLGEMSRKGLIPSDELAFNPYLLAWKERTELTKEQALNYLHGDTFALDVPKQGFRLVTYQQIPLGWIKHLGNRFNNLYPKEWRIRMDIPKS